MAQSRHSDRVGECPLSGAKRTSKFKRVPSAFDPSRTLGLVGHQRIFLLDWHSISRSEVRLFADGMVEDIITALSRFKALFVIARNSSFTYKGRAIDVKVVGRELGV